MARITMSTTLKVPADSLWNLVGNFNGMPDWHPAFARSELEEGGKRRRLTLADGGEVYEQLESRDDEQRTYAYTIIESPLDVNNYVSRLAVLEGKDGDSTLIWACEFKSEGSEAAMMLLMQDIYDAGFDNLKKIFGLEEPDDDEE